MKRLTNTLMYLFIATAVSFTSCSPEDGADGMDGAPGEQGIAGQDGQDGEDGQDGQDGNANVTSILLTDQTITNGANVFNIPELTQDIVDNGFVYGYITVNGNNFWEDLPVSIAGDIIIEIDQIELEQITLLATFNQSGINIRFVLVEGNTAG